MKKEITSIINVDEKHLIGGANKEKPILEDFNLPKIVYMWVRQIIYKSPSGKEIVFKLE